MSGERSARRRLPVAHDRLGRAVSAGRAERRGGAHHRRRHEPPAQPDRHHRERRRRRRHARHRAGRGGGARRLHAAGRRHGLARRGSGAHAQYPLRCGQGFRADRAHRQCAGRGGGAQGFSGQGSQGIHRLCEGTWRRREAGPWRHRLVVAHGLPAADVGARSQTETDPVPRHRTGAGRPHRRSRRLLSAISWSASRRR